MYYFIIYLKSNNIDRIKRQETLLKETNSLFCSHVLLKIVKFHMIFSARRGGNRFDVSIKYCGRLILCNYSRASESVNGTQPLVRQMRTVMNKFLTFVIITLIFDFQVSGL